MTDWLNANARIKSCSQATHWIAAQYGRDWRAGRRTAMCAAHHNTPLWQEAVRRHSLSKPVQQPLFTDAAE